MTKKKASILALVLFVAVAVFGLSFMGARMGTASKETTAEKAEEEQPLNACQSISLPGYDVIKLRAGRTEQSVYFYNPAGNRCFITFSVILDGKELYTSGMLAPNTKIESIALSTPLPTGNYDNALLRYSCYDLYTQRELNGAEIAVKLEVE